VSNLQTVKAKGSKKVYLRKLLIVPLRLQNFAYLKFSDGFYGS